MRRKGPYNKYPFLNLSSKIGTYKPLAVFTEIRTIKQIPRLQQLPDVRVDKASNRG